MPVQFDNSVVYNHGLPQTVEESFQIYANWARVHDFDFDELLSEGPESPGLSTDWDTMTIFATDLPYDIVMKYTVDGAGHGVVLNYDNSIGSHVIFGLSSSGNLEVYTHDGTTRTTVLSVPADGPAYGDVVIASRQQRFSDDETDIWHTVSMWIDDALIGTHTMYLGEADENEYRVGVVSEGTGRTFTNISVPQLTEFAEWSSIDPGEATIGGLERAIEGRYVKYFIRFDGAMRAWRSSVKGSAHTFEFDEMVYLSTNYDKRQLYNHVRMTGGYAIAEYVRSDLISKYGHRFIEINNPYLITETMCYREARRQIVKMEERYTQEIVETPFTPVVELEDRVTTENGERIVTSKKWSFGPALISQELQLREYLGVYDS